MRVTALASRFVSNLKRKRSGAEPRLDALSLEEISDAKVRWCQHIQLSSYTTTHLAQLKTSLGLFTDDNGVLRCKGRIGNAPIPYDARFPIILPRHSHFTRLIILDCHRRVMHNGVKDTLTELRSAFWVVRGRQTVKSIINRCVTCKRIEGNSYKVPPAPPLPEFRLSDDFAFTRVG